MIAHYVRENFALGRENGETIITSREPVAFSYSADGRTVIGQPAGDATLPIDVNVGRRGDESVYLRVFASPESAIEIGDLHPSVKDLAAGLKAAGYITDQCPGESECVERCPDGKGGTFCCKHECV